MVERRKFSYNGYIKEFEVVDGKVCVTIGNIANPTIEQFEQMGWKEVIE